MLQILEFPDARIRRAPVIAAPIGQICEHSAGPRIEHVPLVRVSKDGVEEVAVGPQLDLGGCSVAVPDRSRLTIARRRKVRLAARSGPVQGVEDTEFGAVSPHGVQDPGHRAVGFLVQAEADQRIDGEGRVAYPGVAVVPVLVPADPFRQRGGDSGGDGATRLGDQRLQRQSGAGGHRSPSTEGGELPAPAAPGFDGPVDPVVDRHRRGNEDGLAVGRRAGQ